MLLSTEKCTPWPSVLASQRGRSAPSQRRLEVLDAARHRHGVVAELRRALLQLRDGQLPVRVAAGIEVEQRARVRRSLGGKVVARVEALADALERGEGAQHEGEGRGEAEGLVDSDGKDVLAD